VNPSTHPSIHRLHKFVAEALDVGFQVRRNGHVSGLADEELALEVPNGIPGAGLFLEELPDLGRCIALDLSQLHHDSGKVFGFGKLGNGLVLFELLPSPFPARESDNHELAPELLVEALELGILAGGQTSVRRNVRGVDDLSTEFFHRLDGTVALGGGE